MTTHRLQLLCMVAVPFAACATDDRGARERSQTSGGTGRASARVALFAADGAHSDSIATLGPVEGLTQPMRDDAIYLAEGLPVVRGKREIGAALLAGKPDPSSRFSRSLGGGDASADGRFGFTFGWVEARPGAVDGKPAYATYVAAWTREDESNPFRVAAYYTRASPGAHPPARARFPLLTLGPGASGVPRPGEVEQQRRTLLGTDSEFSAYSVAHGYTVAFAEYAAEFTMPFGRNFAFLVGRQEVLDFYKGSTPTEVLEWTPLFADSSESGDLGYTVGTSITTTAKPDGAVERAYNKYLSLWARRADGAWRFVADGGAAAPAPLLDRTSRKASPESKASRPRGLEQFE